MAIHLGVKILNFFIDSHLIVNQVNGEFHAKIKALEKNFKKIEFTHFEITNPSNCDSSRNLFLTSTSYLHIGDHTTTSDLEFLYS